MATLDVRLVPALSDNYVYLLRDTETGTVAIVDPAEPEPVEEALARLGWRPSLILNTHHHGDHIGGNEALKERHHLRLTGPRAERGRIPGMDDLVAEGDRFHLGKRPVRVFEVPGHTRGHVAFWFEDADALFCGDTLFALGCGRLFEGTPAQMWDSLLKLRGLPDSTRVYCGHEYTAGNARFALSVDPDNAALQIRAQEIADLRARGEPTIPSLLGIERATNPFLRADDPALAARLGMAGAAPAEVLGEIRRRKDHFR
ncbi:MAG TPA: hydroxyacylglutathione hydrolase [Azospirillaceae bacterium]|nr:hydroxyacylglutathione hydrolase [Azospirillaceae bacterium]